MSFYDTEPEYADPGRLRTSDDHPDPPYIFCDACGQQIYVGALSLQGVGIACCREHMDALVAQHEAVMNRKRA